MDQKLFDGNLTLKITKARAGKGRVNPTQLAIQTDITDPIQDLELGAAIHSNVDTTVTLPVTLSNKGLTSGYALYQVGVYAEDPDLGEILYFIAQSAQEDGEAVPSAKESPGFTIDWNFGFNNANASKVDVTLNEAGKLTVEQGDARYAKKEALEDLKATVEAYPHLKLQIGGEKPDGGPWIWFDGEMTDIKPQELVLNLIAGSDSEVQAEVEQQNYNVENATTNEQQIASGKIFVDVID